MAWAPGRLELLGNHTDYNEGLVMSVAVDKYVCMAASPRTDGKIELVSSAFPQPDVFWISELFLTKDMVISDKVTMLKQ